MHLQRASTSLKQVYIKIWIDQEYIIPLVFHSTCNIFPGFTKFINTSHASSTGENNSFKTKIYGL